MFLIALHSNSEVPESAAHPALPEAPAACDGGDIDSGRLAWRALGAGGDTLHDGPLAAGALLEGGPVDTVPHPLGAAS